jgi:hypothetical protein
MVVDESYVGENLVFLVGCPRSGTTWLQRLLATHPQVRTGQESHLFDFYIGPQLRRWREVLDPAVTGRGGVGIGCYITEEQYLTILRQYMLSLLTPMLQPVAPGELFLDKTPEHALFMPEIHRFLPLARVIHMIRDPRDVAASLLAASRSWGAAWAPRTVTRAALTWEAHVRAVRREVSSLPPSLFLEVRYEDLAARPVATLQRAVDFLRLAWSESELARAIEVNQASEMRSGGGTAIPVRGAFANAAGMVVEPEGFVRHARPGAWRRELTWSQRLMVQGITGQLMAELGYARARPILTGVAKTLVRLARWHRSNLRLK